jgi:curved DNA-binding protein CbpA
LFIDYYEDLQVSPNADKETIDRIYRMLAKRYHPDNETTGDMDKFDIITKAHKILSDPEERASYDVGYDDKKKQLWKELAGKPPANKYENDQHIRRSILSVLYVERRKNVFNSGIGLWHLEKLLGWPESILDFHVWYLKEKSWIERTDTGGFAITAHGVDEIEKEDLILRKDRLLTHSTEASNNFDSPSLIEDLA